MRTRISRVMEKKELIDKSKAVFCDKCQFERMLCVQGECQPTPKTIEAKRKSTWQRKVYNCND